MRLFASLASTLGELFSKYTSGACVWSFWDEEKMPKSLLK